MDSSIGTTIFVTLLLAIGTVSAFEISDCTQGTNPSGKLKSVTIDTCPDASGPSCPLIQGKNVSIEVNFDTVSTFKVAKLEVYGYLGPIKTPFYLNPDDACGNYGFNCPVKQNESEKLTISLPIKKIYPRLSLTIQLVMRDENKNPIVCLKFPARITGS